MMQAKITHGGETITTTADKFTETCDMLIAKHGAGVPKVEMLTDVQTAPASTAAPVMVAQPPAAAPVVRGQTVDTEGKLRSLIAEAAAKEAGFTPAKPIYERGTMVVDMGVENAKRSRQEHDAKPTVREYCKEFIGAIASEERKDVVVPMSGLRMTKTGRLTHTEKGGKLLIDERAFGSMVTRMGMGGAEYLRGCWPELRAINVNNWMTKLEAEENKAEREDIKIRTRKAGDTREAFGFVSKKYTSYDVDKIAEALMLAAPADARGTVAYDGYKAKFEVMFHSNVQPKNYVAGEYFKSGIIARTDDTGGGSIVLSACVWQNLCLNLIVIDEASQVTARLRHIGSVEKLAAQFREGFATAMGKLDHFLRAWGYASEENVVEVARKADPTVPHDNGTAFLGLLRGAMQRELVPVRGNVEANVTALRKMWEADQSSATATTPFSRAAMANAFTRYAHEVNQDPFLATEIETAAGALVYSKQPIPFVAGKAA